MLSSYQSVATKSRNKEIKDKYKFNEMSALEILDSFEIIAMICRLNFLRRNIIAIIAIIHRKISNISPYNSDCFNLKSPSL